MSKLWTSLDDHFMACYSKHKQRRENMKSSKGLKIAATVLLIVIIAGGVGAYFIHKNNTNKVQTKPSSSKNNQSATASSTTSNTPRSSSNTPKQPATKPSDIKSGEQVPGTTPSTSPTPPANTTSSTPPKKRWRPAVSQLFLVKVLDFVLRRAGIYRRPADDPIGNFP